MSGTLEHKRVATQRVKSLGLQADLRARAVILAAEDSTVGSSLRDMIQLNEDDPALKALVEEFLRAKGTGKVICYTGDMRFGQTLTANVSGQGQPVLCCADQVDTTDMLWYMLATCLVHVGAPKKLIQLLLLECNYKLFVPFRCIFGNIWAGEEAG